MNHQACVFGILQIPLLKVGGECSSHRCPFTLRLRSAAVEILASLVSEISQD